MRVFPRGHGGNAYALLARPSSGLGSEAIADTRFLNRHDGGSNAEGSARFVLLRRANCNPRTTPHHDPARARCGAPSDRSKSRPCPAPADARPHRPNRRRGPDLRADRCRRITELLGNDEPQLVRSTDVSNAKNPTRVLSVTRCSYAPAPSAAERRVNVAT
jgi:hypothetical protein